MKKLTPALTLYAATGLAAAGGPCPGLAFDEFSQQLAYSDGVPRSLGTGDLNRDGFIDAVVSGESSTSIYYGSATGDFSAETPVALPNEPSRMIVGDLDGDGWPDITTYGANGYSVVFSDPGGLSVPVHLPGLSNPSFPSSAGLTLADLNGDGITDIVGTSLSRNGISVLLGLGGRAFAPEIVTDIYHPFGIDAADLDGDGLDDLVVSLEQDDELVVFSSNGDGTFTEDARLPIDGTDPNGVRLIDIDGDDYLDIVANNDVQNAGVSIFFGSPSGAFVDGAHFPSTVNLFAGSDKPTVVDLDGDGDLDIVTGAGLEGAAVLLNAGDRKFLTQRRYDNQLVLAMSTAAADINGDGRSDVLVASWFSPFNGLLVVENICDQLCSAADLARPIGEQDLADITAFVELFTAGNPIADLNQDDLVDLADIVAFVGRYQNSCDGGGGD